ncbi:hypothetical protein C6P42_000445 [Pichia californica]|nr:hypothetical protein C6P42_000445 [[Candida] californica]
MDNTNNIERTSQDNTSQNIPNIVPPQAQPSAPAASNPVNPTTNNANPTGELGTNGNAPTFDAHFLDSIFQSNEETNQRNQQALPVYNQPTQKTFNYVNDCSVNISVAQSGFTTVLIYIKNTPFFGIGTIFSQTSTEFENAEIHYNSKIDFLLDEDIDPNGTTPLDLDKERRNHKISIYKIDETNEYRIDFVKMAKTGIKEIDDLDPWKDFDDRDDGGNKTQIELVKDFTDVLKRSKDEPDMVLVGKACEKYPELKPCVGVVMFKRAQ